MAKRASITIKRAYDPPAAADGQRILVDRLWPRGLKKDSVRIDAWLRDVAPSTKLRQWFGHDPARWKQFVMRYRRELRSPSAAEAIEQLRSAAKSGRLTLVYAAKDEVHNDAVVLRDFLLSPRPRAAARRRAD